MSLQAYQQAAQRAEHPRETEYRLFAEVTRALMSASTADDADFLARIKALDWNRRLWATLAADCGSDGNGLTPQPARVHRLAELLGDEAFRRRGAQGRDVRGADRRQPHHHARPAPGDRSSLIF